MYSLNSALSSTVLGLNHGNRASDALFFASDRVFLASRKLCLGAVVLCLRAERRVLPSIAMSSIMGKGA